MADDPDIRLSPAGTAAQQFASTGGELRWLYLTPANEHTDIALHIATDDEVADWPRLRVTS